MRINATDAAADRTAFARLETAIATRDGTVAIVGCGYLGLPLAISCALAGFRTVGLDPDTAKVARLRSGNSPIHDVPSAVLQAALATGRLEFRDEMGPIRESQVVLICVATPIDASLQQDNRYIVHAAEVIATEARVPQLVVVQSTVQAGTTETLVGPILERHGRRRGADLFVASSPDRLDPVDPRRTILDAKKLVGGLEPLSTSLARRFFATLVGDDRVQSVATGADAELGDFDCATDHQAELPLPEIRALVGRNPGQMTVSEYVQVYREIIDVRPARIVIFGAGRDTSLWARANSGGETVVVEDDPRWLRLAQEETSMPITPYLVAYRTDVGDWRTYDDQQLELASLAPLRRSAALVLVDAPLGDRPGHPGRMQSVFMAASIVRRGGTVLVHDMHREVEQVSAERYLGPRDALVHRLGVWRRAAAG